MQMVITVRALTFHVCKGVVVEDVECYVRLSC